MTRRTAVSRCVGIGRVAAVLAAALVFIPLPAEAQGGVLGRVRKRAQERVEEKIERKADSTVVRAIDGAPANAGQSGSAGAAGAGSSAAPGEGAWANYDFVPGERVLFTEDFMSDNVGDFPRRLTFREGELEIVEWEGGRHLRATNQGRFEITLPEVLPQRFTIEFDYNASAPARLHLDERTLRGDGHTYINFAPYEGRIAGGGVNAIGAGVPAATKARIRVMADGQYLKLYLNEKRVGNVPNASFTRSNKIIFTTDGGATRPQLFSNFRIAGGGRDLYDALAESGRVTTQGILFDTGSDRLRPESTPTLKQIARMLQQHPELRIAIEGHTDNVGDAQANMGLSQRRAAAVMAYLVGKENVAADRLQPVGLGATKPVAPNTTPEGRQNNRRVELVKL